LVRPLAYSICRPLHSGCGAGSNPSRVSTSPRQRCLRRDRLPPSDYPLSPDVGRELDL